MSEIAGTGGGSHAATGELDALLYSNPLASPADIAGFTLEGDGATSFPQGRMRLESTRDPAEGQTANIVLWCDQLFPADIAIEWQFWPLVQPGLAMLFFAATGGSGEDVLSPDLAPRTGEYDQYYGSDINAYHISYFRRRAADQALHTCNLRKSAGFHLVAQGADPIPPIGAARPPYKMTLHKRGDRIRFWINDLPILDWVDDGSIGGPHLQGGRIGFRQMAPLVGEYANLTIRALDREDG